MKQLVTFLFLILPFCASAQPPTLTSFTPASGPIGTLVTLTGTDLSNPTSLTIGGTEAVVVSNDGSTLVAMVMPGATTGSVSITTAGGGPVVAAGTYTVSASIPPALQQGAKLVGTGASGPAQQGTSVAVSADGNTAIVGGRTDNGVAGAAWIYTRSAGVWSQQGAKLVGTGATGTAGQGRSVSISADGNTAIVGGEDDDGGVGAAWVFTRSAGVWTQQGPKLVGTGAVGNSKQGLSVYLSADGNTALVGGPEDDANAGAVWVYTRSAGVWTQQGSKLVGTGAVGTTVLQGIGVALSAEGNTAIVGAFGDDGNVGAAWVYTRSGGVWTQQGSKLVGTGATGNAFQGFSVALSADGNTALVGGILDNSLMGAAWVYTRTAGVWSQQGAKLVGTGGVGNGFQGYRVGLSADGNTALVSGPVDDGNKGAAWVYTRTAGVWTQQGSKRVGSGALNTPLAAQQGSGAALSADGNTALLSGFSDDNNIGGLWVFESSTPLPVTWQQFSATLLPDQRADIRWTTASELNNERFEIEYSTPMLLLERAWRPLGTVPGSGTTSRSSRYAFTTEALTQGTHYFRLWQVDYDGTRSLSPTVSLRVGESAPDDLELYPNPVSRGQDLILKLSSDEDSEYSLELLDITGRTVLRRSGQLVTGSNTLVLKIGDLPSGTYLGRCISVNKVLKGQVIVIE